MRLIRIAFSVGAVALAFSTSPVHAQHSPPALPKCPRGPGGLPFGGPIMVSGGTNLLPLLKRPDVQSTLGLGLRQKNELNDVLNSPQKFTIKMVDNGNLSDDERKKEMDKQIAAQLGGPEEKIKAILKPEQYSRLQELMLQWRGPIILGDAKVADRLKLEPEHRAQIAQIVSEYNAEKMKVMASLTQVSDSSDGAGNSGKVQRMMRVNTQELENPLSPSYKALDGAKKDAEKRILAVLSSDEAAAWQKAQGAPFTFRTDIKGSNRF
jgi:hypothetical protein